VLASSIPPSCVARAADEIHKYQSSGITSVLFTHLFTSRYKSDRCQLAWQRFTVHRVAICTLYYCGFGGGCDGVVCETGAVWRLYKEFAAPTSSMCSIAVS
jgi:hypothetical protein